MYLKAAHPSFGKTVMCFIFVKPGKYITNECSFAKLQYYIYSKKLEWEDIFQHLLNRLQSILFVDGTQMTRYATVN